MSDGLNPRQQAFVQHYTTGMDGVRGNATAAYRAAGYTPRTAHAAEDGAYKLLRNSEVALAIRRYHAQADAQAITKLRDWKTLAEPAQQRLECLARGIFPPRPDGESAPITGRNDAAVAQVMLSANVEILERAYPKKFVVDVSDPRAELAVLIGVPVEDLPDLG